MTPDLFWPLIPQLAQEAHNIYHEFLSSQALSPVNIDRQAWLSEEMLAQPRPDMFRAQQLQVRGSVGKDRMRRDTNGTPMGHSTGPDTGAESEPEGKGQKP